LLPKKTEIVSFRISEESLKELRKKADSEQTSMNYIVNLALKDYLKWHVCAAQAGLIPLPKILLEKIINFIPENEIIQIAKYIAQKKSKEMILIFRKEHSVSALIDIVKSWCKISNFVFIQEEKTDGIEFLVQHEMGKKWSCYFMNVLKFIFEELGMRDVNFETCENSIIFNLKIEKQLEHK